MERRGKETAREMSALTTGQRTTAKSQNACCRLNTGTSAVLPYVAAASGRLSINMKGTGRYPDDPVEVLTPFGVR